MTALILKLPRYCQPSVNSLLYEHLTLEIPGILTTVCQEMDKDQIYISQITQIIGKVDFHLRFITLAKLHMNFGSLSYYAEQ